MYSSRLLSYFEELISEKIISSTQLYGGDINEVYVLQTSNQKVVVKLNSASRYPDMFKKEAKGLYFLEQLSTFTIPKIIHCDNFEEIAFLMLTYIESGNKNDNFWKTFGEKLALLHQQKQSCFGFENDNYIGSLFQKNQLCDSPYKFYTTQRLQPQFELAEQKGYVFSELNAFYKNIEDEIPKEQPSLIHGDLWSGNFMIDKKGTPCLIDPAVSYAPREMDIAMMHLFGGFDSQLFDVYDEIFPFIDGWENRLSLWQLYYLLVHLNLFGDSYYNQVKTIVKSYI